MYWKFIVPIARMKFVNVRKMPILLLVDKNSDLQKIYCGVSKAQLKEQAEKRRTTEHKSHADSVMRVENAEFAGYKQINELRHQPDHDGSEMLGQLMDKKAVQLKRLGAADRADLEGDDFMSIPSIKGLLDDFSTNMLPAASDAQNMLELQEEFEALRLLQETDNQPMQNEEEDSKQTFNVDFKFKDYFTF
jgi:hypothetical protein